ncbi:MAG: hypothetical protein RDV48_10085 [Candidatus Eremiobacteraeota bacterium]|nr:hypothetical protein [Candidatus Eremiobacteraeota bacterium]
MIGGVGGGGSSSVMTMAQMQQADMQLMEQRALELQGKKPKETGYPDPYAPLKNDLAEGADEIAGRHRSIEGDRQQSRYEYAVGEHGLGSEVVNQSWNNFRENVGNTATVLSTGAKAAFDVGVAAPAIGLVNAGHATVDGAADTVNHSVGHVKEGGQEIAQRHRNADMDRTESRQEYAKGEHGLASELIGQGWINFKENVGNTGTALKTGAHLGIDAATAPARFLWNTATHLVNGR